MDEQEFLDPADALLPEPEPILHDPGMIASENGMRARDPWEMEDQ
jgi:hypothetical protein